MAYRGEAAAAGDERPRSPRVARVGPSAAAASGETWSARWSAERPWRLELRRDSADADSERVTFDETELHWLVSPAGRAAVAAAAQPFRLQCAPRPAPATRAGRRAPHVGELGAPDAANEEPDYSDWADVVGDPRDRLQQISRRGGLPRNPSAPVAGGVYRGAAVAASGARGAASGAPASAAVHDHEIACVPFSQVIRQGEEVQAVVDDGGGSWPRLAKSSGCQPPA